MVCLGNICRSPLAHGILESKLDPNKFKVDSAGTARYHIGNRPDYRSIEVARNNGINISEQRSRQFAVEDFDAFDIIYAMDRSNYNNIIAQAESPSERDKVRLILNENPDLLNKDVPDPYYGDYSDFEYVFNILDETCVRISKNLMRE